MERTDALLRLALVPGLGSITASRLLEAVEDPAEIFDWTMARLRAIDGIGPERARRICDPAGEEAVVNERAKAHRLGIRIHTLADDSYPIALRRLEDPPLALWVRGELRDSDRVGLAVVGPRRPSASGHRQARRFGGDLARVGCCVISGLARGVDTAAHEAALDQAGGRTVAVIGSGFDHCYPEENRPLADRIADGRGAVISEFPCATRPSPGTFPRRNRIVAALAMGVLVIEAGERSGSLITARLSGELGKEVFALPGPVDRPEHIGSNRLLRDGATLITAIEDLIEELAPLATLSAVAGPQPLSPEAVKALTGRERAVYGLLGDESRSVDDLVRLGDIPVSAVQATLISLELKRLARRGPTGYTRAC